MEMFLVVCACVFVALSAVVAVFMIQTLVQMRLTARSMQVLAENLNQEVLRIHSVSQSAANVANLFSGSLGKFVTLGVSLANSFLKRQKESTSEPAGSLKD